MAADRPSLGDTFVPFVKPEEDRRELTVRSLIIGSLLGILFGASSVYLALKVGITVSASIPIAVLSIPVFRALGNGSILENNITQTTGSAGESIAAGIAFTMPALLVLGYDIDMSGTTLVALTGGWLGVLMMIPLRRSLIVKEHGNLAFPEGTACAEVLEAGEKKGAHALIVTLGFAFGFVYKGLYKILGLWKETPTTLLEFYKRAQVELEGAPELLGVGYIIGPRNAGSMVAGGVLSYLVLMPLIRFFGDSLAGPLAPSSKMIRDMSASQLRGDYILYIGVGCVASAGILSLIRTIPTIVSTFTAAMKSLRAAGVATGPSEKRTDRELPITLTLGGALLIAVLISVLPGLHVNPFAAVLVIIFGFFFATVSSRITGQIGTSSNPISGMTIATILLTSLLFVVVGWTGGEYRPIALTVGAIVCIAAANAGGTAQDLKTGFLIGATPRRQQIALFVGVTTSALVVAWTLFFINRSKTTIVDERIAHPNLFPQQVTPAGAATVTGPDGLPYKEVRLAGDRARGIPAGKVFVDDRGTVAYSVSPGIFAGGRDDIAVDGKGRPIQAVGEDGQPLFKGQQPVWKEAGKFVAPKAQLMALLIDSILDQNMPWSLVLFGVFITIVVELAGVEALPFAVGLYLPLGSSAPIFVGGAVRWLVDRRKKGTTLSDSGTGVLFSSGLIAGGTLCGLLVVGLAELTSGEEALWLPFASALRTWNWPSLALFGGLGYLLFHMARREG